MEVKLDEIEVTRNSAESRFEAWIDGKLSKLDYTENGDTIAITHVGVPVELRGMGIAAVITRSALEYAKANSLRVIPICPYVVSYLRRNPQYMELTKNAKGETRKLGLTQNSQNLTANRDPPSAVKSQINE